MTEAEKEEAAEDIAFARQDVISAQLRLATILREACPGPHKFIHHRDARPAWCPTCGYGQDGVRYHER